LACPNESTSAVRKAARTAARAAARTKARADARTDARTFARTLARAAVTPTATAHSTCHGFELVIAQFAARSARAAGPLSKGDQRVHGSVELGLQIRRRTDFVTPGHDRAS